MLSHFFTSIIRNIWQHRKLNVINTIGFAVGIASCLVIGAYVYQQYSFDKHHVQHENIYRVCLDRVYPGKSVLWAPIAPGVRDGLLELAPVADATRIIQSTVNVQNGDDLLPEEGIMVDSSFFNIFTTKVLQGDVRKAIADPKSIIITKRTAEKYFPGKEALGNTLHTDRLGDFKVEAVVENYPENSHIFYDIILSLHVGQAMNDLTIWNSNFGYYTYILLKKNTSAETFQSTLLPQLTEKYLSSENSYKEWRAAGNNYVFFLQPLKDIHLHSDLKWEFAANGNYVYVNLFMWVGIMVLFIACINFTNLSSARFSTRMKEVGIRKVLGSMKKQIILQYLLESLLLTFMAMVIAIGLIALIVPYIDVLTGAHIDLFVLSPSTIVLIIVSFSLFVGLVSGLYPAIIVSRFKPVSVLTNNSSSSHLQSRFRDYLLILQFSISFFLICGTFVIYQQIEFFKTKDLGYKKDNIMVIDQVRNVQSKDAFKNDVLKVHGVSAAAYSSDVPGKIESASTYRRKGDNQVDVNMTMLHIDSDVVDTWQLQMKQGRNFVFTDFNDTTFNILLNETAVKQLGLPENPIGSLVDNQANVSYTVVGVIKDFHLESLHKEIRPAIFFPLRNWVNTLSITFDKDQDLSQTRAGLENVWKKYVPEKSASFFFLDERYSSLYGSEEVIGKLSIVFTVLALMLTLLGLYGLSSFSAERRTKEIGIRKVLGASAWNILLLFVNQTNKLIAISIVLSIPIAYYVANTWLENFAYRTTISIFVYGISGLILIFIAVVTVLLHSVKATRINPAETLRVS